MVEKTASNCFRLGFVNKIFPDSRILYITRDGRNNINSLINAWMHPSRFFTYKIPEEVRISNYPHGKWKFVLPPGWREYLDLSLEEVCAFQWKSCHAHVLDSIRQPAFAGRVLRLKLEDLQREPVRFLRDIAVFCGIRYNGYLESIANDLPVVNSPDGIVTTEKWKSQNKCQIERIFPHIESMMEELGYNE